MGASEINNTKQAFLFFATPQLQLSIQVPPGHWGKQLPPEAQA